MKRTAFKRKLPPARPSKVYTGASPGTPGAGYARAIAEEREVEPIAKFDYVRSRLLLANVKQLHCTHCMLPSLTDPAHSNWAIHGKGKGIKASDIFIAALCRNCHTHLDQGSVLTEPERQRMWWHAHVWTVKEMLGRSLWPLHLPIPDIVNYPKEWA